MQGVCVPQPGRWVWVWVRKPLGRAHPGTISLGCQLVDADLRG